jgi:CspA family cold shock protein
MTDSAHRGERRRPRPEPPFAGLRRKGLAMSAGTVKWFAPGRGFGFIAADDGNSVLSVHYSDILSPTDGNLSVGQRVQFEIGADGKALRVRPLTDAFEVRRLEAWSLTGE